MFVGSKARNTTRGRKFFSRQPGRSQRLIVKPRYQLPADYGSGRRGLHLLVAECWSRGRAMQKGGGRPFTTARERHAELPALPTRAGGGILKPKRRWHLFAVHGTRGTERTPSPSTQTHARIDAHTHTPQRGRPWPDDANSSKLPLLQRGLVYVYLE